MTTGIKGLPTGSKFLVNTMSAHPFLSIIVPVYNGGNAFAVCLKAIDQSSFRDWELIVVDDGSTDNSAAIAKRIEATLLQTGGRMGPGAARNLGAQVAQADYLCFIDADCEVHPDTLANLANTLKNYPEVDAVFGSYDDKPKAPNFIAQYKNLLHHYTHQNGKEEASTFWAGCGTVKRSAFLALGGFDVRRYPRPSIEDIDLGYRIRHAGGKIHLAKQIQVKHHKAWQLNSLVKTDVFDRAIPWTKLLLSNQSNVINDLNLQTASRISIVATYGLLLFTLASFIKGEFTLLIFMSALVLMFINWDVYRFFYRKRGVTFMVRSIGMHWFYYFYSGLAFVLGILLHWQNQYQSRTVARTIRVLKRSFGLAM